MEKPHPQKLTRIEVGIIKKSLPNGSLTRIAKRCNLNYRTVWAVLEGEFQNLEVVKAAFEVIDELHEERERIRKKLDNLLN